ncbi:MAG: 16S rRNA (guanine(527)-N(7))-methyltransferase RsmG [Thiobacillaceae bacterium]|nr:16S rRNA (guanine(527)-N(7))-methyltransferase RsmG [Thiobacillaceae bacterium]
MISLDQLDALLRRMGHNLDADRLGRLLGYVSLLEKWNRVYNLTAIHEPERMLSHHLLDSLAVLPHITADRLLDVGSGGGLPGIPIAVARPQMRVTLIDASHKKCAFLQQAAIQLGLDNVEVVHGRVEAYRPAAPCAQIISRAFSDLGEFVRLTRHLLAPDGEWLAMKGLYPNEEIARLEGARVIRDARLSVPELDAERHLIVMGPLA